MICLIDRSPQRALVRLGSAYPVAGIGIPRILRGVDGKRGGTPVQGS
jgi:hypothetical protein